MTEEDPLGRIGRELREWMRRHDVRGAADAKALEYLPPGGSRKGVPFSELKTVFAATRLLFELGGDSDVSPNVTVSYNIDFRRPRFRYRPTVGRFEVTFLSNGRLASTKFEIDDDLLRELRKPPKGSADPAAE
ncbi:MAG: hypothetical protein ACO1SV_05945 [Fimbriimonas sp.]